jgi:protein involved in polysaccharide export with SLBB domain
MRRISISILLAASTAAASLSAQTATPSGAGYDTRQGLEAAALAAENANRMSEAMLLRGRLSTGDFQEGDRIVVVMDGTSVVSDTMQVRAGRVLQFAQMGELSLDGVLRSELNDRLRLHLARYLTNPSVRATPLLALAVLGSVRNPGYIYAPADYVLRDLIMRAGGPAPDANVAESVIRRNGQTIWDVKDVRSAVANGLSLDRLHLHAGDEVFVPPKKPGISMSMILSIAATAAAISVAATNH